MFKVKAKLQFTNPHSLQGKMFIGCILTSLAIMSVSLMLVYQSAAETIERNASVYMYENIKNSGENLGKLIDDAYNSSLAIAINKDIVRENLLPDINEASYEWFLKKKDIESFLSSLIANKVHLKMAAIVDNKGRCYQSGGELILKNVVKQSWYKQAKNLMNAQVFYNTPAPMRILVCRPIISNGSIIALAIVELDYSALSEVHNAISMEQAQVITFSSNGEIVFSNSPKSGVSVVDADILTSLGNSPYKSVNYQFIDGEKTLVVNYYSQYSQLTTKGFITHKTLISDALKIKYQAVWVAVIAFVFAFIASLLFSRYTYRNLLLLRQGMQSIKGGDLKVRVDIGGADETSEIATVFNQMMDTIENLMDKVKSREKEKRILEQNVLYAQIQPHFICNTINSIKYVAHKYDQIEIENVATALSELIRSVMENRNELVTLWEEHQFIDKYILIQRFKYSQPFSIIWDIEETMWRHKIPKLILQPIVENALIHGIAGIESGVINIKAYRQNGLAIFQVIDNGKGMPESEIEHLNAKEHDIPHKKMGIANVFERIKLIYGNEFGGIIQSHPSSFTCVELRMPEQVEGYE